MFTIGVLMLGIALSYVAPILGSSVRQEFKTNSSMSDKTCGVDKVFTKPRVANSVICAVNCNMNEACVTFAYSNSTGQCDGCGNFYKNLASLTEDMPGSAYYTPTRKTGYTYVGCVSFPPDDLPMLNSFRYYTTNMTVELCSELCDPFDLPIFGLEYGTHCHCGNEFYGRHGASTDCITACDGNNTQLCGGVYAISSYKYTF